MGSASCNCN